MGWWLLAKRACLGPRSQGCPIGALVDAGTSRCPACSSEYERGRGTRQSRGYDAEHDRERASIQRRIDKGERIACVTCDVVLFDRAWDLGHNADRTAYIGPQCEPCNRGHRDGR